MKKKIVISLLVFILIFISSFISFQIYKSRFINAECKLAVKSRLINAQLNLTETLLSHPIIQKEEIKERLESAVSQLNSAAFLTQDNQNKLLDIKSILQTEHYSLIKTGDFNKNTIKKALDKLIKFNSGIKD